MRDIFFGILIEYILIIGISPCLLQAIEHGSIYRHDDVAIKSIEYKHHDDDTPEQVEARAWEGE